MKTIEEKIAVMQAYVDGKTIECYGYSYLNNWTEVENPRWDWWNYDYRVKQEPKKPKYRPYKDAAECFKEVQKHGGWIKAKYLDEYFNVGSISSLGFVIMTASGDKNAMNGNIAESFDKFFENNVWADDGSVCGVLEN